ncbi:hypothetical protein BDZ89DRAFT_1148763 [Hymenopellis radicata]|nr:hypothetical protein BDZ89DRAFT_1148763 [Hymenopellis radicata]
MARPRLHHTPEEKLAAAAAKRQRYESNHKAAISARRKDRYAARKARQLVQEVEQVDEAAAAVRIAEEQDNLRDIIHMQNAKLWNLTEGSDRDYAFKCAVRTRAAEDGQKYIERIIAKVKDIRRPLWAACRGLKTLKLTEGDSWQFAHAIHRRFNVLLDYLEDIRKHDKAGSLSESIDDLELACTQGLIWTVCWMTTIRRSEE